MSNLEIEPLQKIPRECIDLINESSRVLVTLEADHGAFEVGATPFVTFSDEFYLYLDRYSLQTDNLLESGQASLMFIEDELATPNILSRRCLRYSCKPQSVPWGYQYTRVMIAFQERFGAFMDVLKQLPNRQIVKVVPGSAHYVDRLSRVFSFQGYELDPRANRRIPLSKNKNSLRANGVRHEK